MKMCGCCRGLGATFAGFLQAQLQSGFQLVLETTEDRKEHTGVDFVITGEGKLDGQTSMKKEPLGVAQLAPNHKIPVLALAGGINEETAILNELSITSYFSIVNAPMPLERSDE